MIIYFKEDCNYYLGDDYQASFCISSDGDVTSDLFECHSDVLEKIVDYVISNGLNSSKYFVDNYEYVVRENDTFDSIAKMFRVRVGEIMDYNGISELKVGSSIRIPFCYADGVNLLNVDETRVPGIDVSYYQGVIDWSEVSKYVGFANIQLCDFINVKKGSSLFHSGLDKYFEYNVSECDNYQIPFNIYYYSRAVTLEDALNEADIVIDYIEKTNTNYKVVYMDLECDEQLPLCRSGEFNVILEAVYQRFLDAGIPFGVYCNRGQVGDFYREVKRIVSDDYVWSVSNFTYDQHFNIGEECNDVYYVPGTLQISQYGICPGIIPNDMNVNGDVDYDLMEINTYNRLMKKNMRQLKK